MKTSLDLVQTRGFDLLLYIDGVNCVQDRVAPVPVGDSIHTVTVNY